VGLDYITIDRHGDETAPAHHKLLGSGIPVLEGIDLAAVPPGRYTLICLPLKIKNGEASPVRAILVYPPW
jgi:arylformamidase